MGFRLVLTAAFVIGGTIETSTSGARIVLDGPRDVELLYDAGGNLIASLAPGVGTDALGNHYLQGLTTYDRVSNQWTQVVGGNVNFGPMVAGQPNTTTPGNIFGTGTALAATSHTDVPSGRTAIAKVELDSGNPNSVLASGSPQISLFSASTVPVLGGIMGAFTALDPALAGTLGPHVWHTPSYNANWAGGGAAGVQSLQYRIDAEDGALWDGVFHCAAVLGPGLLVPVQAVPAAPTTYRPKATRYVAVPSLTAAGAFKQICVGIIGSDGTVALVVPNATAIGDQFGLTNVAVPLGNLS